MPRSLTSKVTFGFGLFLALTTIAAAFTIIGTIQSRRASTHLVDYTLQHYTESDHFAASLNTALGESDAFMEEREGDDLEEAQAAMQVAATHLAALDRLTDASSRNADEQDYRRLQQRRVTLMERAQQQLAALAALPPNPDVAAPDDIEEALDTLMTEADALQTATDAVLARDITATKSLIDGRSQWNLITTSVLYALLILLSIIALMLLRRVIVRPINELARVAQRIAEGRDDCSVDITSRDEIGKLQQVFNQMAATVRQQTDALQHQVAVAEAARLEVERAHMESTAHITRIEEQQTIIRNLSVPILPLSRDMLVMPLVGEMNEERVSLMQSQALGTLEQTGARLLLLDITGVPRIDNMVAAGLVRIAQAARLLGTEVILVGITPHVAQTLANLDLSLAGIRTLSTLESGIAHVLNNTVPPGTPRAMTRLPGQPG
ncbi:MAG TPA: HAMP domain-containing protein [Herpetosiphonaceae bacterium]